MWLPRKATTEEQLTTLPLPCSTITGMTCRQHRNGPFMSRLMVRSQTDGSTSVTGLSSRSEPPAQLSSTSMRPNASLACRTICLTLSSSVTSVRTKRAPAPASRALVSPSVASISATTTFAPSATNCLADARPMPEPAPVITATLPSRRFIDPSPRYSSTPEPLARDRRAVAHRLELGPDHVLGHLGVADDGAEAAIGPGHDALAVADGAHGALQPLGDHLRVLDIIVRRLDHAADQGHAIGQLLGPERVDLVAVTRVGEGQAERTGLHLEADRQHVGR